MHISFSRNFKKMLKKQPKQIQLKFLERLEIFVHNSQHPLLNNHSLAGEWFSYRSINITGDVRAIFEIDNTRTGFVAIGSHSELYS